MSPNLDAIKKAIVANLKPGDVPEGLHHFSHDAVVRVRGSAKRGKNTFIKPTSKLPLLDILAVVIAKAGIMGPHILDLIGEAAREAAAAGTPIKDHLETTKKAIKTVEEDLIRGMTMIERQGVFTGAVEVELLSVRKT